jgi:hypothetical protein
MVVESKGRYTPDSVAGTSIHHVVELTQRIYPQILPWDSDLDLQVSEETIYFLAKYYNMTEYYFPLTPGSSAGRHYLLEINPHYTNGGTEDKSNVIDARWIDTETGLFIDISTIRKNWTAIEDGVEGALMCKDRHHYLVSETNPPSSKAPQQHTAIKIGALSQEKDIYPLRTSFFEGLPVKIPFEYAWLLEEEYGRKALTVTQYEQ